MRLLAHIGKSGQIIQATCMQKLIIHTDIEKYYNIFIKKTSLQAKNVLPTLLFAQLNILTKSYDNNSLTI